jgi:hypothetical protein
VPGHGLIDLIDADYATRFLDAVDYADGPIYMLGLSKFRPGADQSSRRGTAAGGSAATDASIPLLSSVGAELCLVATVVASSLNWDRVAVIGFPSRRAFLDLTDHQEFRDWSVRHEESNERIMLLGTLPTEGLPAANNQRLLLEMWNGPEPEPLVSLPAARFDVEGTAVGDGRQWSGVRYTPIELGTPLPLPPARFGYQALLVAPVIERWI